MLLRDFEKLEIKNVLDKLVLNEGDYFLTTELENQKTTKKIGDEVVVYKVLEVRPNGNLVYSPCYIYLE